MKKIVLGVTDAQSIRLMRGFPEFLVSQGWQVSVISSWNKTNIPPRGSKKLNYINIPMARNPNLFIDLISLVIWVICLRKIKPDLVLIGTPKAALLGLFASWLIGVEHRIYQVRGLRFEGFSGIKRYLLLKIEELTIHFSTRALTVSESLRHVLLENSLTNEQKLLTIGLGSSNGVNTSEFQEIRPIEIEKLKNKYGVNTNIPVVGYLGRIATDKGIDDLLIAHNQLSKTGIDSLLLIAGKIEDELLFERIKRCEQTTTKIKILNYVPNPEEIIHLMDILCLPTYREGFPNVVLEASSCSIPVVTTTATGAVDSVIDGVTGILVEINNPMQIFQALEYLVNSPDERMRLGKNGRKFVMENFDRSKFWAEIESFLSSNL